MKGRKLHILWIHKKCNGLPCSISSLPAGRSNLTPQPSTFQHLNLSARSYHCPLPSIFICNFNLSSTVGRSTHHSSCQQFVCHVTLTSACYIKINSMLRPSTFTCTSNLSSDCWKINSSLQLSTFTQHKHLWKITSSLHPSTFTWNLNHSSAFWKISSWLQLSTFVNTSLSLLPAWRSTCHCSCQPSFSQPSSACWKITYHSSRQPLPSTSLSPLTGTHHSKAINLHSAPQSLWKICLIVHDIMLSLPAGRGENEVLDEVIAGVMSWSSSR